MEPKYKIGQVVIIAEDIDQFGECEHRHLIEIMKEAYSDLALIVDVKPAKGPTNSKDDGFNYYIKIFRDRSYIKECEAEYWTSDLFEECTTPKFKINDIVHFTDSNQYETDIVYRVNTYYKDLDDSGNLAVGYELINVYHPEYDYRVDAHEVKYLELVQTEQVSISSSEDVEFLKQQINNLKQKLKENENRLRKQEESIARNSRSGELGIFNRTNQVGFGRSKINYSEIALTSRKRIDFLKN